ncbi:MAG: hypothetical protein ACLFWH_05315 [Actinomycetota bacterium]
MTTEEQIREEIESIDWDAIRDQNRLEDIGSELYDYAAHMDTYSDLYDGVYVVGIVAGIMDSFSANRSDRMRRGDGQHIAAGFAKAMVRAAANAACKEEETE